jgi:hypothetical protein
MARTRARSYTDEVTILQVAPITIHATEAKRSSPGSWPRSNPTNLGAVGDDGTVRICDPGASSDTKTVTVPRSEAITVGGSALRALAISPKGTWLAAVGDGGRVFSEALVRRSCAYLSRRLSRHVVPDGCRADLVRTEKPC